MLCPEYIVRISCGDIGAASAGVALIATMARPNCETFFKVLVNYEMAIKMIPISAALLWACSMKPVQIGVYSLNF
jgi:hypothetical protein